MKKIAIGVGVLIVLVVALASLPFLLDVNKYRGRIQSELQGRTGRPISLGNMDLKVFPLAFRVQNAVIGEDSRYQSTRPFVQVNELLVSAKLLPLLQGNVEISSLRLNQPKIELIKNSKGVWNFASLGKQAAATSTLQPVQPQQPPAPTPPRPQQQQGQDFSLGELRVTDGQVAVTDAQKKQPRSVYDHIDMTVEEYAPNKPVSFDLAAHLPGTGKQTIQLTGKGGPLQEGNVAATNFEGELKLQEVSFSGLSKFLNSPMAQDIEFVASGTAELLNKDGLMNSKGDLTLNNGRVRGVNIGYPITADYDVRLDSNAEALTIQRGDLKLGSTPISISGLMNMASTPSMVDLKIKAQNASIADAARLASAFGVAFNPGTQIAGALDADIAARGSMKQPALNGRLTARELVITGKQLPQAVQVTAVNLMLTPDFIRSNEFVATTGSTAVRLRFDLSRYTTDASIIDASVNAPDAQLGELINIGQAYGVTALDGITGNGAVSLNVRLQGPLKKPDSLNYSGSGNLQNASITLPALTQPVRVRSADLRFTQNAVVLDNLNGSLASTNATGQLTLKGMAPGATPQAQFTLAADKINVTELQGILREKPVPAPAKTAASWTLVPAAHAQPRPPASQPSLASRLVGQGNLSAGAIIYDELQLTNAKSPVTLDRGVIRLTPITAQLYGGAQSGTVVIDTRPTPSTYSVNAKLDKVDANQLLSSVSSLDKVLYGLLIANAKTSFVAGQSSNFAKTLNGTVSLNLLNGKLAGIDLLNELAKIGKFLQGGQGSEPFTNVAKLTGDFGIKNGLAQTDNLMAVVDGGTLAANGAVDLAGQTLNMAVTAVLSKDYAQSVGGTNIGGYLTTALANDRGELVMPVLISGSFTAPRVTPDYKRIAQMKLENLLPTSGSPGALTTGVLGGLLGGNKGEQQGAQPTSPVRGILDALGGKQPQQQEQQPSGNQNANPESDRLPDPSNPKTAEQQQNTLGDILNAVTGGKKQTQQQQQPPPKPEQPKQEPPK